jgi:ribonuclease HI
MTAQRLRLFFDGGCRPNPGRMETAWLCRGTFRHHPDRGEGDSGEAEWLALLDALDHALDIAAAEGMPARIELVGDARAVIEQARGRWPPPGPRLRRFHDRFIERAAEIPRLTLRHVPRARNLAGIALARIATGL